MLEMQTFGKKMFTPLSNLIKKENVTQSLINISIKCTKFVRINAAVYSFKWIEFLLGNLCFFLDSSQ